MKRWLVCALFLFTLTAWPLGAGEPLKIKVSPTVSFAPANLVVRTTIEASAENRVVEVAAESDDFFSSSQFQLDGADAPHTKTFEFRNLPPGMYQVKAVLVGAGGQTRAYVKQQVNVMASGAGQ